MRKLADDQGRSRRSLATDWGNRGPLDRDPKGPQTIGRMTTEGPNRTSVTVDDLVVLAYLLHVSPSALLDLAFELQPYGVATEPDLLRQEHLSDWLYGYTPLPGQNEEVYAERRPPRHAVVSSDVGPFSTSFQSYSLKLNAAVNPLKESLAVGDLQAVQAAGKRLIGLVQQLVVEEAEHHRRESGETP